MGSPTNWRLTGCELIYMRKGKKSMEDEQFYQTNNEWDITKQKNKKETNTQESSHQEAVKTNNSQNIISLQGPLREGTWEDVRGRGRTWKDEGGRETTWKDVRRRGRTREHVRGRERTRKDVEDEGGRLYTWTPPVVLWPRGTPSSLERSRGGRSRRDEWTVSGNLAQSRGTEVLLSPLSLSLVTVLTMNVSDQQICKRNVWRYVRLNVCAIVLIFCR